MDPSELRAVDLKLGVSNLFHFGHAAVCLQEITIQSIAHLLESLLHALRLRLLVEPILEAALVRRIYLKLIAAVRALARHPEFLYLPQGFNRLAVPLVDHGGKLLHFLVVETVLRVPVKQERHAADVLVRGLHSFFAALLLTFVQPAEVRIVLGVPVRELEQPAKPADVFLLYQPAHFGVVQNILYVSGYGAAGNLTQGADASGDVFG